MSFIGSVLGNFRSCLKRNFNLATPMQIINSMLKEFNEEDIIVVSKTLPAIAPLCGLELAKIDDVVLAEFIRLGKTKYSNDDFALLIEKPKSLCEYIINHWQHLYRLFIYVYE